MQKRTICKTNGRARLIPKMMGSGVLIRHGDRTATASPTTTFVDRYVETLIPKTARFGLFFSTLRRTFVNPLPPVPISPLRPIAIGDVTIRRISLDIWLSNSDSYLPIYVLTSPHIDGQRKGGVRYRFLTSCAFLSTFSLLPGLRMVSRPSLYAPGTSRSD